MSVSLAFTCLLRWARVLSVLSVDFCYFNGLEIEWGKSPASADCILIEENKNLIGRHRTRNKIIIKKCKALFVHSADICIHFL